MKWFATEKKNRVAFRHYCVCECWFICYSSFESAATLLRDFGIFKTKQGKYVKSELLIAMSHSQRCCMFVCWHWNWFHFKMKFSLKKEKHFAWWRHGGSWMNCVCGFLVRKLCRNDERRGRRWWQWVQSMGGGESRPGLLAWLIAGLFFTLLLPAVVRATQMIMSVEFLVEIKHRAEENGRLCRGRR